MLPSISHNCVCPVNCVCDICRVSHKWIGRELNAGVAEDASTLSSGRLGACVFESNASEILITVDHERVLEPRWLCTAFSICAKCVGLTAAYVSAKNLADVLLYCS